jgi:hypothetical protein
MDTLHCLKLRNFKQCLFGRVLGLEEANRRVCIFLCLTSLCLGIKVLAG